MQTIAEIEQEFTDKLAVLYETAEVRQFYSLLLEERFGWSKATYLLNRLAPVASQDAKWFSEILTALRTGKPIQYLLGQAWFMGMKLSVNDAVLIPRPETEELVQLISNHYQNKQNTPLRIIDIGTGSGCIAIALKKAFPEASVHALDVSADALHVARQNAIDQSVAIEFIHADILEWDSVFGDTQTFDIVVSNPPYITSAEQQNMHANVLNHEPHLALFVEGNAPLLFYEHIAAFASRHLRAEGSLYFEINRNYGPAVCDLLRKKTFKDVMLHQDMQGADRMVHAKKEQLTSPIKRDEN